jgi:hypothetical protein
MLILILSFVVTGRYQTGSCVGQVQKITLEDLEKAKKTGELLGREIEIKDEPSVSILEEGSEWSYEEYDGCYRGAVVTARFRFRDEDGSFFMVFVHGLGIFSSRDGTIFRGRWKNCKLVESLSQEEFEKEFKGEFLKNLE